MTRAGARVPVLDAVDIVMRPPGSKSETIRAMAASALADGRSHLYGALDSDDTRAMAAALGVLGIEVGIHDDLWSVDGAGGRLDPRHAVIDVNESGLSARIMLAMVASADGVVEVTGHGRLPERPMAGLVEALRSQGVEIVGEQIPIEVRGRGPLWGGEIRVDCTDSTQFATALMLIAPIMHQPCKLELTGMRGSSGYLDITVDIMRRFGAEVENTVTGFDIANAGYSAADVVIEPDASAAVYPMAIAAVTGGRARIDGLGSQSRQPDIGIAKALEEMGCRVDWEDEAVTVSAPEGPLTGVDIDMSAAPDGSLALAVVCLFASSPSRISGLHSLRLKESDRLEAMREEISRIGGTCVVADDSFYIEPISDPSGVVLDSHGDHRIAMSLAVAGTRIGGVVIDRPEVVAKTWPEFWRFLDDLAT